MTSTFCVITKTENTLPFYKISGIDHFSVSKIFDCGQCFRFNKVNDSIHENEFSGVAFGRFVSFAQDGDTLYIYNSTEEDFHNIWCHYLALDIDYEHIENDILTRSDNINLRNALEFSNGIRILNQDKWEAICSFIISQNNNIPRIKKIIEALSKKCGKKIDIPSSAANHLTDASEYYTFPTPHDILELGFEGLTDLKTGFRAKYIYDAAQKMVNGELDLQYLSSANTDEAIKHLCIVKGIGPKVASCALLFSFEKYDAFPIDVWIKKVISKYFITDTAASFDPSSLGKYAGIAQQFLFYYERYGGHEKYK